MDIPKYEIVKKPSETPEYTMVMVKCESVFWWRADKSAYLGSYRQWEGPTEDYTIAVHLPNTGGMVSQVRPSHFDAYLDTCAQAAIALQILENREDPE